MEAPRTISEYLDIMTALLSKKKSDKLHKGFENIDPSTEIRFKTFPGEVIKSEDDKGATLDIISTIDVDRDNEVLLPTGCDMSLYDKIPTVLYGHIYSGADSLPVGVSKWRKVEDGKILSYTEYFKSQFAQDVYEAAKNKALGNSVGFVPTKWLTKDNDGYDEVVKANKIQGEPDVIYTEWQLLEYSKVPIPANAGAITMAYKSVKSDEMKKELDRMLEEIREKEGVPESETVVPETVTVIPESVKTETEGVETAVAPEEPEGDATDASGTEETPKPDPIGEALNEIRERLTVIEGRLVDKPKEEPDVDPEPEPEDVEDILSDIKPEDLGIKPEDEIPDEEAEKIINTITEKLKKDLAERIKYLQGKL